MDNNNDDVQETETEEVKTDETTQEVKDEAVEKTDDEKPKKKVRRPLTEEQRQRNIENLKKAREKKKEYNQSYRDKQKKIKSVEKELKTLTNTKRTSIKQKKQENIEINKPVIEETIDPELSKPQNEIIENKIIDNPPPPPVLKREKKIVSEPRYTLGEYKVMHQKAITKKKENEIKQRELQKQQHIMQTIANMSAGGLKC